MLLGPVRNSRSQKATQPTSGLHHRLPGMFDRFKSKDRKTADKVLALLARAIKEIHPNRFIDPEEEALLTHRILSQLNLLLGKDDDKRFAAVAFDDVVAAASDYERKGLAVELGTVVAHDSVLIALVAAAMHERHGGAMRDDVRARAEQLLRYINPARPL
jgi:hypothetical protein